VDKSKPRPGDKVEVKSGRSDAGERGVVLSITKKAVNVLLDSGRNIALEVENLRNYSLAARKAWIKMPKRAVGRPKGSSQSDRVSVTLRFDRSTWQRFLSLEKAGLTGDRVQLFNSLLDKAITMKENQIPLLPNRRSKGSAS
jgi:ribosomal protein L24